jgi:xyloglucan-specific exo-beta-1,4-glucanase
MNRRFPLEPAMSTLHRHACLAVLLLLAMGPLLHADQYQWDTLPIGGGGYVTGVVIHPTTAGRIYIRTDVGGAYSWDPVAARWIQMLDWLGPADANLVGVDGIAIDANLPDRVYLALGKSSGSAGGVYRSDDRGQTWTKLMSANFEGNGRALRWAGECLAVDPRTSSVIYCGTRLDGLWGSTDEGATWAKVAAVPDGFTGTNPTGVRSIAFDPATAIGGRSSTVYVGVPGSGIYRSIDGGASFSALSGAPSAPQRLQVVAGRLYVTHGSGVALWSGGAWSDITPAVGAGQDFCALAVDPADSTRVVVAQYAAAYYNPMYRSSDGGGSWAKINSAAAPATLHVGVPWWPQNRFSSATAGMAFDPTTPGQLFYTDWFGIWRSPNVWATPMDWYTVEQGHEETVVLSLVAPSSGALVLSGMADNFGMRSTDLTSYPASKLYPDAEGVSIAVCEQHPANLAVLGASSWAGANLTMATSADSGATWTTHALPAGVQLGRIACSSTTPASLVYIAGNGPVSYSANGGATWLAAAGAPSGAVGLSDIWNKDFAIAADSVDGTRFYLFANGKLYASADGGASWAGQNATAIPGKSGVLNVVARPGTLGEVWVSLDGNGLWRTTNGGTTFTHITAVSTSTLFSFGAPPAGSAVPTAYCYGSIAGVTGLFRSLDLGGSWTRINDDAHQFPSGAKALAADRQTYGRVFIGSGGCGIFYGQPGAAAEAAPVITTQPGAQSVTVGQSATFSVSATGTPAPTWQWRRNGTTIVGATAASYATPATVAGDNGASFSCVVSNSAGSVTSSSATLSVTAVPATPPTVATPAHAPASVGGTTAALGVLGGPAGSEAGYTYSWSVVQAPAGGVATFTPNGTNAAQNATILFNRVGTWKVEATIADPAHGTSTISGPLTIVISATFTSIVVAGPASVSTTASAQFTASGRDQFAQALASQPTFAWTATGGSVSAGGLFTAGADSGTGQVAAALGAINGHASVTISGGTAGSTGGGGSVSSAASGDSSGGHKSCGLGSGIAALVLVLVLACRLNRQRGPGDG